MKKIVNVSRKFYCLYRFPGWVLHELSHEIFFWVMAFFSLAYNRNAEYKVRLYDYSGSLSYRTDDTILGELGVVIISLAPTLLYYGLFLFMLFIDFSKTTRICYLVYSATTFWFLLSPVDNETLNNTINRLKNKVWNTECTQ